MKRYLKKLVINANLLFTELLKTLLEVEHVLNDKTLCYSYSAEVEEVLMPNCLLYGRHLNSIICGRENLRFRKLLNVFGMCGIKNMLPAWEDSSPRRWRVVPLRWRLVLRHKWSLVLVVCIHLGKQWNNQGNRD